MKTKLNRSWMALIVLLICGFFQSSIWASIKIDGIYYNLDISRTIATVTHGHGVSPKNGYFGEVIIPNSITYNGILYNVTGIEKKAFSGCTGLTSVTIPNSVTEIEMKTFSGCTGLISVTIPNSVTRINEEAFSGCTGLTSVTIPNSVSEIEFRAFSGCTGLTSVTIPSSVTSIRKAAFLGCTGLTSIYVDPNNSSFDSRDNCNAIIE